MLHFCQKYVIYTCNLNKKNVWTREFVKCWVCVKYFSLIFFFRLKLENIQVNI